MTVSKELSTAISSSTNAIRINFPLNIDKNRCDFITETLGEVFGIIEGG
jgi:hypothetical protein